MNDFDTIYTGIDFALDYDANQYRYTDDTDEGYNYD